MTPSEPTPTEVEERPWFDLAKAKVRCAELERKRDEEQVIADALHQHAESHDDRVYRLNQKIIGMWELIQEKEALVAHRAQPPTPTEVEEETMKCPLCGGKPHPARKDNG